MNYSGSKFLGVLGMIAAGIFLVMIGETVNDGFYERNFQKLMIVLIAMTLLLMLISAQSLIRAAGNSKRLYDLEQGQKEILKLLSESASLSANLSAPKNSAAPQKNRQKKPKEAWNANNLEKAYDQIADAFLIQEKQRVVEEILALPEEAFSFKLSLEEQVKIQDQDLKAALASPGLESRPVGNLVGWVKKLAFEYDLPEKACDLAKIAIRNHPDAGFIDSAVKLLLAEEQMNEAN